MQVTMFLKLYLLNKYETHEALPVINIQLIRDIFRLFKNTSTNGNNGNNGNNQVIQLRRFLDQKFPTDNDNDNPFKLFKYKNLDDTLTYASRQIVTSYDNNIIANYKKYVKKYIFSYFNVRTFLFEIKTNETFSVEEKKEQRSELFNSINTFINHLLSLSSPDNDSGSVDIHDAIEGKINEETIQGSSDLDKYSQLLSVVSARIIPVHKIQEEVLDDVNNPDVNQFKLYYYLKCNPQCFLPYMLYMMKFVEVNNGRLLNLFPLRKTSIPQYAIFDTAYAYKNLLNTEQRNKVMIEYKDHLKNVEKKTEDYVNKIKRLSFASQYVKFLIFSKIMKKKILKKNNIRRTFRGTILTDGYGISILYNIKSNGSQPQELLYTEDLLLEDNISKRTEITSKDMKVVGADPNLGALLYFVDYSQLYYNNDTTNQQVKRKKLIYSQKQRLYETKSKYFKELVRKLKAKFLRINNINIDNENKELGENIYTKTVDTAKFIKYIKLKLKYVDKLSNYYEDMLFRKIRFDKYTLYQKSEDHFMKRFKEVYGDENEVVVCIGDWSQYKHRRFFPPTIGKGLRKWFIKRKYKVFLVDEYRTSACCSHCEKRSLEKYKKIIRKKKKVLAHGVLRCTNKDCNNESDNDEKSIYKSTLIWDRDENAARNMWNIAHSNIYGNGRPDYLKRNVNTCKTFTKFTN